MLFVKKSKPLCSVAKEDVENERGAQNKEGLAGVRSLWYSGLGKETIVSSNNKATMTSTDLALALD